MHNLPGFFTTQQPGFLRHVIVPTLILIALCFVIGVLCIVTMEKKGDAVLNKVWGTSLTVVPLVFAVLAVQWAWRRGLLGRHAPRFLSLRSWTWPVAALLLVPAAIYVPRPGDLPTPKDAAEIFHPITLITPEGESYRFLAFEEWHKFKPVYAVNWMVEARQEVTRTFGWDSQQGASLGFFRRGAFWKYQLTGTRFGNWKGPEDGPLEIAPAERTKLRPLVVAELNRRAFGRGRLLEDILDNGRHEESSVCWQNLVVLLALLSLPLAVIATILLLWSALFGKRNRV